MTKQLYAKNYLHICILVGVLLGGCKPGQISTTIPSESNTEPKISSESSSINHSLMDDSTNISNESEVEVSFAQNSSIQRNVQAFMAQSEVFSSHFTGFCLYDQSQDRVVVQFNSEKFFTPASNVKILTLYAILRSFGQFLPTVLYHEASDTLYIRPIGDPTVLHPSFSSQRAIDLIRHAAKPVVIEWPEDKLDAFGTGWMWDDYNSGYMPELTWMPVYGNVVKFQYERPGVKASPSLFNDLIEIKRTYNGSSNTISRSQIYNFFEAEIRYPNWSFEKNVPFVTSKSLIERLLEQETGKELIMSKPGKFKMDTLYSVPMDTVLRKMMWDSDNFISEQLLIMAALKNGFKHPEAFREFMTAEWLQGLEPVWIDGSGLSRYNLIRPLDNVLLLMKMQKEFGWERIRDLFPHGGKSGTIKNWYPSNTHESYIMAKTGTLANNHNLSGFLQARSGRRFIFSFMNNNYVRPTSEIKEEMQKLLEKIRDYY